MAKVGRVSYFDDLFFVRAGQPSQGYHSTLFHDEQPIHGVFNEATGYFIVFIYIFLRVVGRGGSVA